MFKKILRLLPFAFLLTFLVVSVVGVIGKESTFNLSSWIDTFFDVLDHEYINYFTLSNISIFEKLSTIIYETFDNNIYIIISFDIIIYEIIISIILGIWNVFEYLFKMIRGA
jgi:hypothetical protein